MYALTLTQSVTALLLCITFCFCGFCKPAFLQFCEYDRFFCVIWCKGTVVVKESLGMLRAIVTLSYILDYYFMLNMHFAS